MPQFFIDREFKIGDEVTLKGSDARHLSQSLRLKAGNWVVLSDGRGRSFRAILSSVSPSSIRAQIKEELIRRAGKIAPVLAIALIKQSRFEWALEKAVELGVSRIVPFISERTVIRSAWDSGPKKLERWRKIALEAAKQSGLPRKPQIDDVRDFSYLISTVKEFERSVLFYEGEEKNGLRSILRSSPPEGGELIIIGPEGGWTDKEVAEAQSAGMVTASLGQQILRVETAAIATLSVWQYELGNMDIVP